MFQIHCAVRTEDHTLGFQKCLLSAGSKGVKAGFGTAESIHNPMTGNLGIFAAGHSITNGPGAAGHSGKTGDLSVGGYFSGGNLSNYIVKCCKNPTAHRSDTS